MIIVQIYGSLGEQMFQYAFGRRVALIHNKPLKLDISAFENTLDTYQLDHFKIKATIAEKRDVCQLINLHHLRSDNISQIDKSLFPIETSIENDPYIITVRDNTYLSGHCWTIKYFAKIIDYLRKEFSVNSLPSANNKHYLKHMQKENSVAVFLFKKTSTDLNIATLSQDYYYRAIETIANKLKNPVFYLFSNQPEYFQNIISINYPHIWMQENQGINNFFEDFRLMKSCKHQIIANTASSWWPAWLNDYKKKIVICPTTWQESPDEPEDFLPNHWLKLNN